MNLPCPLCPESFRSPVALDMHQRSAHPGAEAAFRNVLADGYRQRNLAREEAAEKAATTRLNRLYQRGCPCGNSYEWHMKQRATVEKRA